MKHKNYTKKFHIHFWTTIDNHKEGLDWGINLIPGIDISRDYSNFKDYKLDWFTIIFSFLIFGITLDWRKEWDEENESN